jgi:site-specific DNA-methyltransferase (adenine-specific)
VPPSHPPLALGPFLEHLRKAAGLTRAALARRLGVGSAEVTWWEQRGRLPEPHLLPALAAALGTTSAQIEVVASALPEPLRREILACLAATPVPEPCPTPTPPLPVPALRTPLGALYQGDCVEAMRALPSRSVDCLFADPPFNLGKDYGDGVPDDLAAEDYLAWCRRWLDEAVRVLAPGGALFLYNLPRWNLHLAAHLDRHLEFKHWIAVDIKFSLPIPRRLYPAHYALLYFVKGPRPRVFAPPRLPLPACRHCGGELKDYGGYKDKMNPRGVNLTDVWADIPPVRHRRHKNRGANELALKLMDRVLDIASAPGDLVLDPFAGSGTSLVAAELKGRRWIGVEVGDCQPIVDRLGDLEAEREQLARLREGIDVLFTPATLALRARCGHDTSRYRVG